MAGYMDARCTRVVQLKTEATLRGIPLVVVAGGREGEGRAVWSWQEEEAERIAFSMRATGHMIGSRRSGIPPGPTHAALQAAEDGVIGRPGVGGGKDGGPVSGGIHEDLRQCLDVVLDHRSLNSIPVEGDGAICGRAQKGLRSAKQKRKEGRGASFRDPIPCCVGWVTFAMCPPWL